MKNYLHIWAMLMLVMHLSSLAIVNFLPGERAGVSIRKVCLRQEGKTKVAASTTDIGALYRILLHQVGAGDLPDSEPDVKACSVKLLYTADTGATEYVHPPLIYEKPAFRPVTYTSLVTPSEPDPPRFS